MPVFWHYFENYWEYARDNIRRDKQYIQDLFYNNFDKVIKDEVDILNFVKNFCGHGQHLTGNGEKTYRYHKSLEEEFDIEIAPESAENITTVEEAVELIKAAIN